MKAGQGAAQMEKITLRLPTQLHKRLTKAAENQHRSINSQLITLIEQGLTTQRKAA